eukprot:11679-Chlamydomonas_euryale.AAC.9
MPLGDEGNLSQCAEKGAVARRSFRKCGGTDVRALACAHARCLLPRRPITLTPNVYLELMFKFERLDCAHFGASWRRPGRRKVVKGTETCMCVH